MPSVMGIDFVIDVVGKYTLCSLIFKRIQVGLRSSMDVNRRELI